jgi:enediyne polyketide synthase
VADPATSTRQVPAVAVVGLACRYPDADDAPELLDVVLSGRRSFRRIPPARLDLADYYQPDRTISDATYSTRAALIYDWRFDRRAFGIDQTGYVSADPALWLALETTARALAGAGLTTGTGIDRDRTGVIIGNSLGGDISRAHALRVRWPFVRRVLTDALTSEVPPGQAGAVLAQAEQRYLAPFPTIGADTLAGSSPGGIAAAISGYFGFRGASHAVDSACTSSLQAIASACSALTAGDLDAAVAGGVDVSLDPLELIGMAKAGVLATGDVRIYDETPTGFLPAEGCGMVVLMRTADARTAGLPVYAEIVGWGVSAAGGPGDAEAGASSQLLAMRRAYERAQVDPCDVQFFEGNGASTKEDDEAELVALEALRTGTRKWAALGSVKANIGNARAAAGAASLIKGVLSLTTRDRRRSPACPDQRRHGAAQPAAGRQGVARRSPDRRRQRSGLRGCQRAPGAARRARRPRSA